MFIAKLRRKTNRSDWSRSMWISCCVEEKICTLVYSDQGDWRIHSQKFFRWKLGIINAQTSALIFPKVVSVLCSKPLKKVGMMFFLKSFYQFPPYSFYCNFWGFFFNLFCTGFYICWNIFSVVCNPWFGWFINIAIQKLRDIVIYCPR